MLPASPNRPGGTHSRLRAAGRDPILWIGFGIWFLSLLPSLVPILSPGATLTWADEFDDTPILLFILIAMAICWYLAEARRERVFWGLLMGCPAAWLTARVLYMFVPYDGNGMLSDQVTDLSYLVGYLCVVLAVEFRPRPSGEQAGRARHVEWLAMLLYGFFLLSYFTLAPSIFRPELYATWVPSMLLFSVIDLYLVIRTWRLLQEGVAPPWAAPFRWLWWVFLVWLAGDLTEGFMYMQILPNVDPGTPLDLLWMAPDLLLLVAARSCSWEAQHDGR